MKKILPVLIIFALLLAMLAIAACGKASESTDATDSTDDAGALSQEVQLLVGTFKLEETDSAVTAEQAGELLPLWQTLQALSASDTAAEQEVQAVVNQIESTMSAQQLEAIAAMGLTQEDVMAVMRDSGFGFDSSDASGTAVSGPSGDFMMSGDGAPPSGNFQGGGGMPSGGGGVPPSGDGMPGGGTFFIQGEPGSGEGSRSYSGTPAAGVTRNMSSMVPAPLLNALVELLQSKIQP